MAEHELDQLIEDTTEQSLAATERIVAIAEETHETAGNIVEKLEHQGEQIEYNGRTAEEIHDDVHGARRDISKLGCFSCCFCAFRPRRKPKSSPNAYSKTGGENGHKTLLAEGPIIKRITNNRNEDKIDENLRKTADIVEELREEAIHIGREVDKHNEALEVGIETIKETDKELKKAIREVKKH